MWTEASRGRIADIERKTKRYPSDLTENGGAKLARLIHDGPAVGYSAPALPLGA